MDIMKVIVNIHILISIITISKLNLRNTWEYAYVCSSYVWTLNFYIDTKPNMATIVEIYVCMYTNLYLSN